MSDKEEFATVPIVCHEAAVTRMQRVVRWIAVCWAASILGLAAVLWGVLA